MADSKDILNDLGAERKSLNDMHAIREALGGGGGGGHNYSFEEKQIGKYNDMPIYGGIETLPSMYKVLFDKRVITGFGVTNYTATVTANYNPAWGIDLVGSVDGTETINTHITYSFSDSVLYSDDNIEIFSDKDALMWNLKVKGDKVVFNGLEYFKDEVVIIFSKNAGSVPVGSVSEFDGAGAFILGTYAEYVKG